ncbi:YicC family protein [Neobacillus piezotolerans]|uniref:YicC family protein n=1 Tax=Neobacillus piezotolerans TaxID=2259171 RepID=A0A3D8GVP6_9BACI|nr:YicC/YloC family endoribonuclease [Neobacillus piezotolerans]RDU38517.1 YicC family protein [Neobacillus piezotolerans]
MIVSMTGFGSCKKETGTFSIQVEVKTVNHRFSEFSFRMPRYLLKAEDKFKKALGRHIRRGRAEVHISVDGEGPSVRALQVDWNLLDEYYQFVTEAGAKYGFNAMEAFKHALGREEFLHIEERESGNEEIEAIILEAIDEAGASVKQMRLAEGVALKNDLSANLAGFQTIAAELAEYAPSVIEQYRARLSKRMAELLDGEVDESRIFAEAALFADKSDIHEELERLKSHVCQFNCILDETEPVGRKLDFLVQEMNREVNTIGSKSNDSRISERVVLMKSLLEKLKEQIQNIE